MTTSRSFAQKREGRRSCSHLGSGVCRKNRISPCRLGDLRVSVLRFANKKDTPPRHGEHGETFSNRHLKQGLMRDAAPAPFALEQRNFRTLPSGGGDGIVG